MKIQHSRITNALRGAAREYEQALKRDEKTGAELMKSLSFVPRPRRTERVRRIIRRDMRHTLDRVSGRINKKWN